MKRYYFFLFSTLALLASQETALAWGQDGHRITAEIAERNLTPEAIAEVREIIGEETLAEISTWADDIRSDGTWDFAKPWHYISINDDESWDNYERVPEEEGDLLLILERLEAFLRDPDAETFTLSGVAGRSGSSLKPTNEKEVTRREVLAFYVHFIGDLHQPLHVGRREDQGGNRIQVEWFGEEETLHRVWDEDLVESRNLSYTEFATFLNRLSDEEKETASAGSYLDWAKEAKEVRAQVYDFGAQRSSYYLNVVEPPTLSYDYRAKTLPIVRDRLQKGGLRLAALLNDIFSE
ncbi:MAG: S1/P1 nuclease [Verrucomicrobiales bacterium]|nr:S1/P1 nuclease [Verrucomicrobiales bacterium]